MKRTTPPVNCFNGDDQAALASKSARASLRASFDQQTLLVEDQTVALQPGMTDIAGFLFADIKTGTRRLIEFILAPLLRASAESMRER